MSDTSWSGRAGNCSIAQRFREQDKRVMAAEEAILADPIPLHELFENRFRNAIEHAGRSVTVTVGDLPNGCYLQDDGPGIPADEREDVFELGYSTDTHGTGFGLAIVEHIAAGHG